MTPYHYDYAVIGGDLRQVYLALELAAEHKKVCCYALCQPMNHNGIQTFSSLEAAVSNSACIICPIPFTKDGMVLNQKAMKGTLPIKQFFKFLKPDHRLYAGCIPKDFYRTASQMNIVLFDFMKEESLSYFNSIATAEGMICEAIQNSPINLHGSKCAVFGYGKCGRTLTEKLSNLSCHVTVVSSDSKELAQAFVFADETCLIKDVSSQIGTYDFIFNTIPSVIFTMELLKKTNESVTILDIASAPGGVDFTAAKELSRNADSYPGLPGKYAPLSSAKAINSTIKKFERSHPCL